MVENLLDSEDVCYMIGVFKMLGYDIYEDCVENWCVIKGSGGVFFVVCDVEECG